MKLRCMVCKTERERTADEVMQVGEWIDNKGLMGVDYLNRLSLEDGYTCNNQKKHKYEFSEDWDKEVHTVAKEVLDKGEEMAKSIARGVQLEEQIKEMVKEKEEEAKKVNELDVVCEELGKKLKEMTGNSKYEIWV